MKFRQQLLAFLIHLRWHYQLLILSGGYLLGGLYAPQVSPKPFLLQFLNVHLLLNGGVTAYNSYWDEDEGPIGGIEHPPKMAKWMHPASIALQLAGLALAWSEGPWFIALWVLTMALSILYSARPLRWKGHPILSLVCVGVGTGTNTFLMGHLAASEGPPSALVLAAASGVALLLLSLYPLSQVYQIEVDRSHGDRTFAVAFGLAGVRRFFTVAYPVGLAAVSATLFLAGEEKIAMVFSGVGAIAGLVNGRALFRLEGKPEEYGAVMRLKYRASLGFVFFLAACLLLRTCEL
jgi:4-hydroxybenzoate polyprenyltransferase